MINQGNIFDINDKLFALDSLLINKDYVIYLFDDVPLPKNFEKYFKRKNAEIFYIKKPWNDFSLPYLNQAIQILINHLHEKGILIRYLNQYHYINIKDEKSLKSIGFSIRFFKRALKRIHHKFDRYYQPTNAIVQLSDLHFSKKNDQRFDLNLKQLKTHLLELTKIYNHLQFVITGDIQNTPDEDIYHSYLKFEEFLYDISNNDVFIVPGNHDSRKMGLGVIHNKKKVIRNNESYPSIKVNNSLKTLFLLFDSNIPTLKHVLGANGHIGNKQMEEAEKILNQYRNNDKYKDYKVVVLLHHHIIDYQIKEYEESRLKELIHGEFFLSLDDKEQFISWLKKNNIKYVMHGHKHLPYYGVIDDINVLSCGSSLLTTNYQNIEFPFIAYTSLLFKKEGTLCIENLLKADDNLEIKVHFAK